MVMSCRTSSYFSSMLSAIPSSLPFAAPPRGPRALQNRYLPLDLADLAQQIVGLAVSALERLLSVVEPPPEGDVAQLARALPQRLRHLGLLLAGDAAEQGLRVRVLHLGEQARRRHRLSPQVDRLRGPERVGSLEAREVGGLELAHHVVEPGDIAQDRGEKELLRLEKLRSRRGRR